MSGSVSKLLETRWALYLHLGMAKTGMFRRTSSGLTWLNSAKPGHVHQRATVALCLHCVRFTSLCVLYIPVSEHFVISENPERQHPSFKNLCSNSTLCIILYHRWTSNGQVRLRPDDAYCIYWLVTTKSLDGMGVQADPFVAYNIMNFAVTSLLDL